MKRTWIVLVVLAVIALAVIFYVQRDNEQKWQAERNRNLEQIEMLEGNQ